MKNPVTELGEYLQNLVRNDPAQVLPAVKDIVVALHAAALESVNVTPAPDLFEVGKSLARLDGAGIEIVCALGDLVGAAGERPDPDLARIEALIATLPAPRAEWGQWAAPVRSRASAFAGGARRRVIGDGGQSAPSAGVRDVLVVADSHTFDALYAEGPRPSGARSSRALPSPVKPLTTLRQKWSGKRVVKALTALRPLRMRSPGC